MSWSGVIAYMHSAPFSYKQDAHRLGFFVIEFVISIQ